MEQWAVTACSQPVSEPNPPPPQPQTRQITIHGSKKKKRKKKKANQPAGKKPTAKKKPRIELWVRYLPSVNYPPILAYLPPLLPFSSTFTRNLDPKTGSRDHTSCLLFSLVLQVVLGKVHKRELITYLLCQRPASHDPTHRWIHPPPPAHALRAKRQPLSI